MVKSDQEVSNVDVKNFLMGELRGVEGLTVMPEEPLVGGHCCDRKKRVGDAEHRESNCCVR